jgi:type III pantothenate kinase
VALKSMNLAVDVGNTLIKVGLFENNSLIEVSSFKEKSEAISFIDEKKPERIVLSSVLADDNDFIEAISYTKAPLVLSNSTPLPITNSYKTPNTLGMDRISACIGAYSLYPSTNCLIIDCGTCIKCDCIDSEKRFHGGTISPGLKMRFEALAHFTAKLPLIKEREIDFVMGRSTEESILSGVINGALFEIEGFIENYTKIFSQLNVILTGGDLRSFESKIKQHIFVIPNLVLLGLNKILLHNLSNTSA